MPLSKVVREKFISIPEVKAWFDGVNLKPSSKEQYLTMLSLDSPTRHTATDDRST